MPKATLDVTGNPSDLSKVDGIIAPRLKGDELKAKDALYGTDQNASLVYVTEPLAVADTSSKTINVTSIGYFYFDGNIWQKLRTGNEGSDWSVLGNNGTSADTNFVGTTDAVDFVVKTDNTERERIYKAADATNIIKKITGGDLNLNGITVGRGAGNFDSNTVVGSHALEANTLSTHNTTVGAYSLNKTTSGENNVAVGHSSMTSNTTGGGNVALGTSSLDFNTTGKFNVAIGKNALSNSLNMTGTHNIAIGFTAAGGLQDGTTNNIAIGSRQQLANATESNQLNIGGAIFGTGLTGNTFNPAGNIGIGTTNPATRLEVYNGTTNGAIKIVDGTQGEGKVLTSDANGLGTWQSPKALAVMGVMGGGYDLPFESDSNFYYTGATITLPPGKWLINISQYTDISGYDPGTSSGNISPDNWMLVRTTFSDQTSVTTVGQVALPSGDLSQPNYMTFSVSGPHRADVKTGVVYINNTSSAPKTYKYIAGQTEAEGPIVGVGAGAFLNNFSSTARAENSITAIAVN
ncbi:hypothetical protein J3D55_003316 [Chryseobacterium ginsenosidimutans]|uniref:hypothetical protein n=1 Tax=Chryseobacterium ginsenosidimutans TaxID=687846 RepID=UPI002168A3AD|nr:hypothetical protein [Chryseobacterium ginsenosidimutans]MCS3870400.1 hypothetical protein [Chryseobacterium ginsenosidimutans]